MRSDALAPSMGVDVLAFTSQSQYKRLQQVARTNALEAVLEEGMQTTVLAAV